MAITFTGTTTHTKTLVNPTSGTLDKVYGADYVSSTSHTTTVAPAGLTAGQLLVPDSATSLTSYGNLTYSEASGPRLTVGSGTTTSVGMTTGYSGFTGIAAMWNSGMSSPSTNNMGFMQDVSGNSWVQGTTLSFRSNAGTPKLSWSGAAGQGWAITAGIATTDVNALSATQTWNAGAVAFTGFKYAITDTASAAGSLALQILGGAAGTTNLFKVDKSGNTLHGGYGEFSNLVLDAGGSWRISGNTSTGLKLSTTSPLVGWTGTTNSNNALDTGLSRISAGVIGVGTGAAGSVAGTISAAAYVVGGAAGASGTFTSVTVVNGIVTAGT